MRGMGDSLSYILMQRGVWSLESARVWAAGSGLKRRNNIVNISSDATSGAGASVDRDDRNQGGRKTVQEYIDETPVWSDGTAVSSSPRTIGDVHWIIGLQTISCMISR
jgi:hypothetical protein